MKKFRSKVWKILRQCCLRWCFPFIVLNWWMLTIAKSTTNFNCLKKLILYVYVHIYMNTYTQISRSVCVHKIFFLHLYNYVSIIYLSTSLLSMQGKNSTFKEKRPFSRAVVRIWPYFSEFFSLSFQIWILWLWTNYLFLSLLLHIGNIFENQCMEGFKYWSLYRSVFNVTIS